jgi:hypothetical protein
MGASAGAMATFSLTGLGLSKVMKYSQAATQEEAQAVLKDINDYGQSDLVSRVATSAHEKRILLGLQQHLGKDFHLVKIDEHMGHVEGQAYLPTDDHYRPWALCNFRFTIANHQVNDIGELLAITKDVAKHIFVYKQHLELDPAMLKHVPTTSILPAF